MVAPLILLAAVPVLALALAVIVYLKNRARKQIPEAPEIKPWQAIAYYHETAIPIDAYTHEELLGRLMAHVGSAELIRIAGPGFDARPLNRHERRAIAKHRANLLGSHK